VIVLIVKTLALL